MHLCQPLNTKPALTRTYKTLLLAILVIASVSVLMFATGATTHTAKANGILPKLCFKKSTNTLNIGEKYVDLQFIGYPSHPNAPKLSVTLPQIRDALPTLTEAGCKLPTGTVATDLLVDLGGNNWLLKTSLLINQNASLSLTLDTVSDLRLQSPPTSFPIDPPDPKNLITIVKIESDGGQVLVAGTESQRIRVYSWDSVANDYDRNPKDGRSYLYAQRGARMDILNAEMMYIGMEEANPGFPGGPGKGERSGLAWRLDATDGISVTGPRGNIINSLIHDNYFGNYTYEAVDMIITGNKVYSNTFYGFDPHDRSMGFLVENNEFYQNGKHGLIFSRGCDYNVIRNNKFYQNKEHGFMLDRDSNHNVVSGNQSYDNGSEGITIYQSNNNLIENNIVRNNKRYGIRVDASWDDSDSFDGLSLDNVLRGNTVSGSRLTGIVIIERADRTVLDGNIVSNNGDGGILIRTGLADVRNNLVTGNQLNAGILINGSKAYTRPTDSPPPARYVPALDRPGHAVTVTGNIVVENLVDGIQIVQGDANIVGSNSEAGFVGSVNFVKGNGRYGIQVNENANNNFIEGNLFWRNGGRSNGNAIFIKSAATTRIRRNRITESTSAGIKLTGGNDNITPPAISSIAGNQVVGTARPLATVEIFRDPDKEGAVFIGSVQADGAGVWVFTLPAEDDIEIGGLTWTQTDLAGNSSAFGFATTSANAANENETTESTASDDTAALNRLIAENETASAQDMLEPDDNGHPLDLSGEQASANRVFLPIALK